MAMINIQISETISPGTASEVMQRAAQATFDEVNRPEAYDVTILLTDDQQVHQLNQEFLQIDAPTDVLAFPADYVDPETGIPYLGDVIISYSRAVEQAQAGGHSPGAEIELLVTHGLLHLFGYDHSEQEEKAEMWVVQARILKSLDSPLSPP